jgi:hypothetical protein
MDAGRQVLRPAVITAVRAIFVQPQELRFRHCAQNCAQLTAKGHLKLRTPQVD